MAVTYGITQTGFVAKTAQILTAQIGGNMQSAYGSSFDVSLGSAAGQLAAIVGTIAGELWEVASQCVSGMDPDQATGEQQDALNSITGTIRLPATYTLVFLTLVGTPTTVVNAGFQAKTTSTGAVTFTSLMTVTIALMPSWQGSTNYSLGNRVTNASRVYYCTTAGTSASSGGPTVTGTGIVDGTVQWMYLGDGTGCVDVLSQAQITGPLVAVSGDVTTIVTPVGGVSNPNGVINILDATPGQDVETDEDFRVRREEELAGSGAGTAASIAADLLKNVTGVTSATVFNNTTDFTDINGVPPHSIEALVIGGADQDIVNFLGSQVVTGTATRGGSSGTYTDPQGFQSTIYFTRPTVVNIYVQVTLDYDNTDAGINYAGDAAVQLAVANFINALGVGKDVHATKVGGAALDQNGVLDVPRSGSLGGTLISTAPSPTSDATISIGTRSIAAGDTSRVTVISTGIAP